PHGLTYPLNGPQDVLAGGRIHAHVRKSTFKLPALASHPIVMVAAGTGIAPFRAFLLERARMQSIGRDCGPMYLFFGCRNQNQDYLYSSELASLQSQFGDLFTLVTAFSRPDEGKGVYVQHRIADNEEEALSRQKEMQKTYSSRDSHVVTHRSTNLPFNCLCMAERTGCPVFS
ncbi:hypothetical protein KCU72_g21700, partial [Aureobasidium melanogenum]